MSTGAKIAIIAAIVLVLSLTLYFVVIPRIKRKKLAEGWAGIFEKAGMNITQADLEKEFAKLSNKDIDKLIDFSKLLQDYKLLAAYKMLKDIDPILKKTDLTTTVLIEAAGKLMTHGKT